MAPVATFFAVISLLAAALPRKAASADCAQVIVGPASAAATAVAISDRQNNLLVSKRLFIFPSPWSFLCSSADRIWILSYQFGAFPGVECEKNELWRL